MLPLLIAAGLFVSALIVVAALGLREHRTQRLAHLAPIQWPPTWAEICAANGGVAPRRLTKKERHRLARLNEKTRCPICFKFAKRVGNFNVCKEHGAVIAAPLTTGERS